ncbi:endonuclease [Roseivirga sp. 4D4]|uniref:GIY-YIG nuclease family protein n=1 Tax=Roseivirga sp. 4D4 TaxID=1889784 RepID=UPI000853516C|nr:GIY-YIG nuclease family protein [Roseivirga sp. 4D4]OEK01919.1 endonuclease [Roseivirga sp. 4D4]
MHRVYILYSPSLDRFYTGETVDVETRLVQHNTGFYNGASTSTTDDWQVFLVISCTGKTQALKVERFIKKQKSSKFIRKLKDEPAIIEDILRRF